MSICIVGDLDDLTCVYLAWCAERREIPILRLSENRFGVDWRFEFEHGRVERGKLFFNQRSIPFNDIRGTYVRFNPHPTVPEEIALDPVVVDMFLMERRCAIHQLLDHHPGVVANRPSSGRSNGSKPDQMMKLQQAGFHVPRWMVSNDEEQARRFNEGCPHGTIYKSPSGLRSRVRLVDRDLLEAFQRGTTPVVLQEYISGVDVRVHTVDERSFGTEISSDGIDYRFESNNAIYRTVKIPVDIEERCARYVANEGLVIGGYDFRVSFGGEWYCLEVNPVPTFLPYEMSTGQGIADALLDYFMISN